MSAEAPADPADLGLVEAAALLRSRALSAVELLAACEARIGEHNGSEPSFDGAPDAVNAWVRLYPEVAHEHARAADERAPDADKWAPAAGAVSLRGIPLALKDLFAVAGLPLTASSRVLDGNVAAEDSAAWRRLRARGVVFLGHTHTHEFAAGGTTDQVGNPWALDRTSGGSSGGSAAALAAGMAPAAVGTDTAGSVRIPAALSGVSAIKPTYGHVSTDGVIPLSPTLDHVGPMARTLADCSALLAAGSGPAPRIAVLPVTARPRTRSRSCSTRSGPTTRASPIARTAIARASGSSSRLPSGFTTRPPTRRRRRGARRSRRAGARGSPNTASTCCSSRPCR